MKMLLIKMIRNGSLCLATQPIFSLSKVMEAEQTKTRSELVHKETAAKYNAAMGRMKQLEKKLKRAINKSKYVLCLETSLMVKSVWWKYWFCEVFRTCVKCVALCTSPFGLLSACDSLTAQLVLVFVLAFVVLLSVFWSTWLDRLVN